MEKIKGLIIKDILQLKTYRRTIVLYIAIFIFSSLDIESLFITSKLMFSTLLT